MSQPRTRRQTRHRVGSGRILAGVLLAIAIVVPLLVWTYAVEEPRLWGFPFFYWYQLGWVFVAAGLTWIAFCLLERDRGHDR